MFKSQISSPSMSRLPEFTSGPDEVNSQQINPSAATSLNEIEFCHFIGEIAAAIETGSVHAGADFVPEQFATADSFELFLSEMDISYKRSVASWSHSFRSVLEATDAIRRARAPA